MDARLDVLLEQEQVVIDNDKTKNDGMITAEEKEEEYNEGKYNAKTFIGKLYEEMDDPHDIRRAMMEEVLRIEEKIKQKESILHMMEEKQKSIMSKRVTDTIKTIMITVNF